MGEQAFRAVRHKSLAAAGLGPRAVDAALASGALTLTGEGGVRRVFPVAGIGRVRFGYEQNKYSGRLYRMQVWSADAPRRLVLGTIHDDEPAFAAIARALAAAVTAAHGPGAVEGGLDWPEALLPALWMTFALIAAVFLPGLEPHRAHDDPLWLVALVVALVVTGCGVPLLGVMIWFFYRPYHPRRLAGAAALDPFLPGAPGGE